MEKHIKLPLTAELAKTLHAGDTVYLTGTIYTSRDAGHKRMCEALAKARFRAFDCWTDCSRAQWNSILRPRSKRRFCRDGYLPAEYIILWQKNQVVFHFFELFDDLCS